MAQSPPAALSASTLALLEVCKPSALIKHQFVWMHAAAQLISIGTALHVEGLHDSGAAGLVYPPYPYREVKMPSCCFRTHMPVMQEAAEQGHVHAERLKVNARQTNLIQYGDEEIDLSAVEQLVEKSQTRAIADAISVLQSWLGQHHNQGKTLRQLLQQLETDMDSKASSRYTMLIPSLTLGLLSYTSCPLRCCHKR